MPRLPRQISVLLTLLLLLGAPAEASRGKRGGKKSGPPHPTKSLSKKERKVLKSYQRNRTRWRRHRARSFEDIAAGQFQGRYVLRKTRRYTAFLDWGDPKHPTFDPKREVGEQDLISQIPIEKRAHILVIPNQKREHLTTELGDKIRADDLAHAERLLRDAEKLAVELGIRDANVFINPSERFSVGYLHVHIIGERTRDYPEPLASPRR